MLKQIAVASVNRSSLLLTMLPLVPGLACTVLAISELYPMKKPLSQKRSPEYLTVPDTANLLSLTKLVGTVKAIELSILGEN